MTQTLNTFETDKLTPKKSTLLNYKRNQSF